jgi:hypothetical protein
MMASLGYAAGYQPLGDEHYGELVRAILGDKHQVVWSGPRPDCVQEPALEVGDRLYWA